MSRAKDERITIRPQMPAGVSWVKASYDSALGTIRSEWSQGDGMTSMDIAVPPGATATLVLPVKMVPSSPENALPKGNGPQLEEVRRDEAVVVYRATAGLFHFRQAESQ
jgi:alpha-L-rhamnosidase